MTVKLFAKFALLLELLQEFGHVIWLIHDLKVVVAPKISLWKKKFFYDFKTGNYIISLSYVRKDTLFNKKNFKIMKNNILIIFFVIGYFLIIAPYQIFKKCAILINY